MYGVCTFVTLYTRLYLTYHRNLTLNQLKARIREEGGGGGGATVGFVLLVEYRGKYVIGTIPARIEENPRGFLGKVTYTVHTEHTERNALVQNIPKYTTPSRRGERVLLNLAHSSQVLRVI